MYIEFTQVKNAGFHRHTLRNDIFDKLTSIHTPYSVDSDIPDELVVYMADRYYTIFCIQWNPHSKIYYAYTAHK